MSKAVWKFTLRPIIEIEMPDGAQVLSVQEQHGELCMWALVDTSKPMVKRKFLTFGTGHILPDGKRLEFVGTALLESGAFVLNVFEESA